jgi:hypothetical protein
MTRRPDNIHKMKKNFRALTSNRKNEWGKNMSRYQALFFAVTGVVLLLGISFFISLRSPVLTVLCSLAAILWIGVGFMVKARARRKQDRA